MFKKMLPWLIMVLIAITLIAIAAFILWDFIMEDSNANDPNAKAQEIAGEVEAQPLSANERAELSFSIDGVTTNLADINYIVKLSFSFLMENAEARHEIELMKPVVLDIIGNTLSDTIPEDIQGSAGKDQLKAKLMNQINGVLKEGKILEISISDFIISRR
jgi:flagellar FliL protein